MKVSTRRAPILAALAIAALAVSVASAGATRTIRIPSGITIKSNGLHFHGRVKVPHRYEPCREDRKVVLFKVISDGPDQVMGRDTTDGHGFWSITPQGSAGISLAHFYAKVKRRSEGTAGTIYVCKGRKSRVIKPSP